MIPGMKLTASSKIVKYLMFIFNLLFVITGIILLSIGLAIHGVYTDYVHFLDNKFLSVPSLLIVVGAIIFLIAFFGCCGAVRENHCMILTFASLMILVFVLELTAGISGYLLRGHATTIVGEKMNETMAQYNKSKEIAFVWDELQQNFKCCGTNSSTDWAPIFKSKELPLSCCPVETGAIGNVSCTTNSTNVYPNGCLPSFLTYVKSHAMELGSVGLGIAFVQAIGIWFSIYLARSIRSSYETV